MQEKGQITKHEFRYLYLGHEQCNHCTQRRKKDHNGDYVYMCENGLDWGPEELPCITRKIQADEESNKA